LDRQRWFSDDEQGMMMSDQERFVVCGQDIAELMPTAELRWRRWATPGTPPTLQQKWVASAKMPDGGIWEEYRWRDVPAVDAD